MDTGTGHDQDPREPDRQRRVPPSERASGGARRRRLLVAGAVVVAAALAIALPLFQPWTLFIDETVDEDLPAASAGGAPDGMVGDDVEADEPVSDMPGVESSGADGEADLTTLAQGELRDRSHPASGTAKVLELEGGSRYLRLEDLRTDNGPDLVVYLSTAGPDDPEGAFDDDFVDLGALKGNIGNQNYEIPPDVDLDRYASVAIWCRRFSVLFGAAPLAA